MRRERQMMYLQVLWVWTDFCMRMIEKCLRTKWAYLFYESPEKDLILLSPLSSTVVVVHCFRHWQRENSILGYLVWEFQAEFTFSTSQALKTTWRYKVKFSNSHKWRHGREWWRTHICSSCVRNEMYNVRPIFTIAEKIDPEYCRKGRPILYKMASGELKVLNIRIYYRCKEYDLWTAPQDLKYAA